MIRTSISLLILSFSLQGQGYAPADPFYTISTEYAQFEGNENYQSTLIRPFFFKSDKSQNWSVRIRNEHYFNNNAPNQENMDVRYFGKGYGLFSSLNISYYSDFLAFSFEPYWLWNQNKSVKSYDRVSPYIYLNDALRQSSSPYTLAGFRDAQVYLHYKGFGIGYSNAGMWWGPGLQGTLSMTNNTIGFPNYMIGTVKEIRNGKFGFMGRYTFAEIAHNPGVDPTYFTSITATITAYTNPIITMGFSRNFITGGVNFAVPWTAEQAAKIIFEGFLKANLNKDYMIGGSDPFDQTISGFFSLTFPEVMMKLYLEIGINDHRYNFWDFVVQPDHTMATIIGFRNYRLFNHTGWLFGFEYVNLLTSRLQTLRRTIPWYKRPWYDDFSYEGRRWVTHSGSDSDDLLVYFGVMNNKWTVIPGFNYERHGVTAHRPAEIKIEMILDLRYKTKSDIQLSIKFEKQYEAHLGFPDDNYFYNEITGVRKTNTLIFRMEKIINFNLLLLSRGLLHYI